MIKNTDNPQTGQAGGTTGSGAYRSVLAVLASSKLATAVGSLVVLACIAGTVLPQDGDVEKFVALHPGWAGVAHVLDQAGFTHVFGVWWFIVLLVLFAFNIAACLVRRMSASVRSGRMGISGWGFLFTHVSMLLILGGAILGGVAGVSGHLNIQEGQSSKTFMGARGPLDLPFEVRLVDFGIEYYEKKATGNDRASGADTLDIASQDLGVSTQLAFKVGVPVTLHTGNGAAPSNALQVLVTRHVPDFVIDTSTKTVSSRSSDPNNPAIFVTVEGQDVHIGKWLFARHPDFDMAHSSGAGNAASRLKMVYQSSAARPGNAEGGQRHIKSYKSAVQLLENGTVVLEKTIEVNHPIRHRGYALYQSGYNQNDLSWSTIQIVKDPGVPVVYAGFICLIGGLVLLLGFKPAAKRSADGAQSLPGEKSP